MVTFNVALLVPPAESATITLDPVNDAFFNEMDSPGAGGRTVAVTLTLPVKPARLSSAMLEVEDPPARMVKLVGLAPSLKLGITFTDTKMACFSKPLAAFNVTVKAWRGVEGVVVTFRVAKFVPPGLRLTSTLVKPVCVKLSKSGVGPLATTGEIEAVTLTFPENEGPAVRVRKEIEKESTGTSKNAGWATIV